MDNFKRMGYFTLILAICTSACSSAKKINTAYVYTPDDKKLHNTIATLDSIFFYNYNTCDVHLKQYADFYAEDVEFYHDKGGVMTLKKDIIGGTEKYVCGRVTRELMPGSIEVYPIKDYGAVEMGLHKFHNKNEDETKNPSHFGKFVIVWQLKNEDWKIAKVISLH
jgi:Domain of unknown function (DUF4440)